MFFVFLSSLILLNFLNKMQTHKKFKEFQEKTIIESIFYAPNVVKIK
jgi:hypothetical protein